jgi:bacterioferritin
MDRNAVPTPDRQPAGGSVTPLAAGHAPPRQDEPHRAEWPADVIRLLNDSLAVELVCVLRYKRLNFTADCLPSLKIAKQFLLHANAESNHADQLATRIVQLGGEPRFSAGEASPDNQDASDGSPNLRAMIASKLAAERVAIESYGHALAIIGGRDAVTAQLLDEILADKRGHADELEAWLVVPPRLPPDAGRPS